MEENEEWKTGSKIGWDPGDMKNQAHKNYTYIHQYMVQKQVILAIEIEKNILKHCKTSMEICASYCMLNISEP